MKQRTKNGTARFDAATDALHRKLILEALKASGSVETASARLGLLPTCTPLDSTRFHGEGRYHSAEEPEEHVLHLTRGSSRDRRPDLPQVRLDLLVAPHAGIPVLMKPRSGQSRDPHDCGQIMTDHRAQVQSTSGTPCRVADRAL